MKVVLGVRKSCDASIVYPNLQSTPTSSSASCLNHHRVIPASRTVSNETKVGFGAGGDRQQQQRQQQPQPQESKEVNLETAIQSKLNAGNIAKPRSRSLIWRPNRKSQKSSNEASDCRVS